MMINKIREISIEEANQSGIQTDTVAVCKKIRKLAKLDRVSIDETEYPDSSNRRLFSYIEYCGRDVLDYIKEYLSNLQPYMIERKKNQEKEKSFICVIDKLYRISVYIKINEKQFEEVVISFHEDNIRGIAKSNAIMKDRTSDFVPVIADSIGSIDENTGNVSIKIFAQRGMKVLPLNVIAIKCHDFFIVRAADVENQFISYCNEYIRDLYTSNLNLDFSKIEVFTMLQQISFTSYGRDCFSSISLLIDSLTTQKDAVSKSAADFALVTFSSHLTLTEEQKEELIELLEEKYMVTDIRAIDDILYRVKAAITGEAEKDPFAGLTEAKEKTEPGTPPVEKE